MAEFENFRKRSEKEKSQMFDMGAKTIVEKILPVIDNFERGLAAVPDDKKDDPFITGMDKVYKQMLTELDAAGVKPIECVGQEFDPDFHNAVMHVEDEEFGENVVAEEFQKAASSACAAGTEIKKAEERSEAVTAVKKSLFIVCPRVD
jgi:molecular chaperone GrpE